MTENGLCEQTYARRRGVHRPFTGSDSEAKIQMVRRMRKVGVFEAQKENQGAREREVMLRSERKAGPRLGRALQPGQQRSVVIQKESL